MNKITLMVIKRIEELVDNLKSPPSFGSSHRFCYKTYMRGTRDQLLLNKKIYERRTGREMPELEQWL